MSSGVADAVSPDGAAVLEVNHFRRCADDGAVSRRADTKQQMTECALRRILEDRKSQA